MEFTLRTTLNASRKEVFAAWLDSKAHTEMTGGKAEISAVAGNTFTAWNGYITGRILSLEKNKRILQSWRTSEFEDSDEDSQVEILLEENKGTTELTLIHTQLPENGEQYIKGWREHYFAPMHAFFP